MDTDDDLEYTPFIDESDEQEIADLLLRILTKKTAELSGCGCDRRDRQDNHLEELREVQYKFTQRVDTIINSLIETEVDRVYRMY